MSSSPLFILVAWSVQRWKNRKHPRTTVAWQHATAVERWGREEAARVWPHPGCAPTLVGPSRDRLHVVGSWVGLDHYHIGARPKFFVGVGLCLVLWYRIYITLSRLRILIIFHLYSNICPAKHVFSNTSRIMSIVKAYVSKHCLFLLFWIIIGSRMLSLLTANKHNV